MSSLKSLYHFFLAWFGNLLYDCPSRKLFVLGITGTKGKSTVLELINAILEQSGKKTALLSSIRIKIGEDSEKNLTSNTMPGRFFIQRFLRRAVQAGCSHALIEVTSQGAIQHRHLFIEWNAALITNLKPEHIEAHGSFDNYRQAKISFFKAAAQSPKNNKLFFINEDITPQNGFLSAGQNAGQVITYSREIFTRNELGRSYDLNSAQDKKKLGNWLLTDFNLENAAAASAFAQAIGIEWKAIKKTLENFRGIVGRMEFIQKKPFAIVIDYAHTPDSLEKLYKILTTKNYKSKNNKMICVLGAAGGGRDKWKRPVMGKIAAQYCDAIILTDEDPYDENPAQILSEIKSGIPDSFSDLYEILNRKEAIRKALFLARQGDLAAITGKGSEPWMHLADSQKISWNEREIIENFLSKKKN